MRMLLVEDDFVLGGAIRDQVVADGHSVDWMKGVGDAGDAIVSAAYEIVLLDLMLPDGRGLDFLKARRAAGDATPVIVLTARDQISDRIAALDRAGAGCLNSFPRKISVVLPGLVCSGLPGVCRDAGRA
jgi:two-component system OmpR family response regulator